MTFPLNLQKKLKSKKCRVQRNRKGLLRQANHESRRKRMEKKWEDDDFYASDEDEFLDRTGSIEKKRKNRQDLIKFEFLYKALSSSSGL